MVTADNFIRKPNLGLFHNANFLFYFKFIFFLSFRSVQLINFFRAKEGDFSDVHKTTERCTLSLR